MAGIFFLKFFYRQVLFLFRIPGEAQKIDRIIEKFSHSYYSQNSTDTVFHTLGK